MRLKYLKLREGKILITGPLEKSPSLSIPIPAKKVYLASYVLEGKNDLSGVETIEDLYRGHESLDFIVYKNRWPPLLAPFQHPDPYTDEHKIALRFDDMMTVFLGA